MWGVEGSCEWDLQDGKARRGHLWTATFPSPYPHYAINTIILRESGSGITVRLDEWGDDVVFRYYGLKMGRIYDGGGKDKADGFCLPEEKCLFIFKDDS